MVDAILLTFRQIRMILTPHARSFSNKFDYKKSEMADEDDWSFYIYMLRHTLKKKTAEFVIDGNTLTMLGITCQIISMNEQSLHIKANYSECVSQPCSFFVRNMSENGYERDWDNG